MTSIDLENNIYSEVLHFLETIIKDNVIDINDKRANNPIIKKRKWIYPTTPENNDQFYPRLSIIQETPRFEESSAGRYLSQTKDSNGFVERETFTNLVTLPVTIGVFTKKDQAWEVSSVGGEKRWIKNSNQVTWLMNYIQKVLHKTEPLFNARGYGIKIKDLDAAYEDNDFLWAGNINIEFELNNYWSIEYSDGSLIKNINQTETVQMI